MSRSTHLICLFGSPVVQPSPGAHFQRHTDNLYFLPAPETLPTQRYSKEATIQGRRGRAAQPGCPLPQRLHSSFNLRTQGRRSNSRQEAPNGFWTATSDSSAFVASLARSLQTFRNCVKRSGRHGCAAQPGCPLLLPPHLAIDFDHTILPCGVLRSKKFGTSYRARGGQS